MFERFSPLLNPLLQRLLGDNVHLLHGVGIRISGP